MFALMTYEFRGLCLVVVLHLCKERMWVVLSFSLPEIVASQTMSLHLQKAMEGMIVEGPTLKLKTPKYDE